MHADPTLSQERMTGMVGGIAVTLRSSCSCLVTFYRHAIPTSQHLKNVFTVTCTISTACSSKQILLRRPLPILISGMLSLNTLH